METDKEILDNIESACTFNNIGVLIGYVTAVRHIKGDKIASLMYRIFTAKDETIELIREELKL